MGLGVWMFWWQRQGSLLVDAYLEDLVHPFYLCRYFKVHRVVLKQIWTTQRPAQKT
ncbi:hypothetical protein HMPREF0576_1164 [Mobiluncus holmesii ATCC 35242]|uniref:Uncharacterized protein n=1 Tax=Mobiluncus holmesii ATCC 35242 TaxID=887899 RepID=E6M4I2_9ACTO|nr:hypothetical protein HMPREF0576_1164 [Mobiluncus holmesii ATCC 35242]